MAATPKTPKTPADRVTDRERRHDALIRQDLARQGYSDAHDRRVRIARDEVLGRPPGSPRLPCPCELALWRGVPRELRRHAVLCSLWVPPEADPR